MTEENGPVEIGEEYTIEPGTGFFLVAYPLDNSPTEFEFSYGLVGYTLPKEPEPVVVVDSKQKEFRLIKDLESKKEKNIWYAVSITAISLIAAIGVAICCVCRKNKNQVNILNEDEKGLGLEGPESARPLGTLSPRPPNNGNETSMQIEDLEDNEDPAMAL